MREGPEFEAIDLHGIRFKYVLNIIYDSTNLINTEPIIIEKVMCSSIISLKIFYDH